MPILSLSDDELAALASICSIALQDWVVPELEAINDGEFNDNPSKEEIKKEYIHKFDIATRIIKEAP